MTVLPLESTEHLTPPPMSEDEAVMLSKRIIYRSLRYLNRGVSTHDITVEEVPSQPEGRAPLSEGTLIHIRTGGMATDANIRNFATALTIVSRRTVDIPSHGTIRFHGSFAQLAALSHIDLIATLNRLNSD